MITPMGTAQKKTVAVIGLGYVGLPLAVRAVERGYDVIGFDTHAEKVEVLKKKKSPIEDQYLIDNIPKFPERFLRDFVARADLKGLGQIARRHREGNGRLPERARVIRQVDPFPNRDPRRTAAADHIPKAECLGREAIFSAATSLRTSICWS